MAEEMGLHFSEYGEKNRLLFYSYLNDINIIVEDKDKEYEYEIIFKRLLKDRYKIVSLFTAGGKQKVIERFEEFGKVDDNNTKMIYVVDGDFDRIIHEAEMIRADNFIYLSTYNIENYFIDEEALIKFAQGKMKKTNAVVRRMIDYSKWQKETVNKAEELYILYCAVQKSIYGEKNVGQSPYIYINSEDGSIREEAFIKYYEMMKEKNPRIDNEIRLIKNKYNILYGTDYFSLICGKFMMISLFCYTKNKLPYSFCKDDFRWWMINHFDINKLNYVKDKIDKVMEAN